MSGPIRASGRLLRGARIGSRRSAATRSWSAAPTCWRRRARSAATSRPICRTRPVADSAGAACASASGDARLSSSRCPATSPSCAARRSRSWRAARPRRRPRPPSRGGAPRHPGGGSRPATSTSPRRRAAWRLSTMPDGLDAILRLVADGRLSADEAAPLVEALSTAEETSGNRTRRAGRPRTVERHAGPRARAGHGARPHRRQPARAARPGEGRGGAGARALARGLHRGSTRPWPPAGSGRCSTSPTTMVTGCAWCWSERRRRPPRWTTSGRSRPGQVRPRGRPAPPPAAAPARLPPAVAGRVDLRRWATSSSSWPWPGWSWA